MWRLPGPQPSAGLFTQTGSGQVRRSQALRPDAREPGEVAGLGRLAVRSVGFGDPLPGPEDWLHVGLRARTHFTASVRGEEVSPASLRTGGLSCLSGPPGRVEEGRAGRSWDLGARAVREVQGAEFSPPSQADPALALSWP